MKIILIVVGILAVLVIVAGFMDAGRSMGHTAVMAGAIVLAGVLISAAIVERKGY